MRVNTVDAQKLPRHRHGIATDAVQGCARTFQRRIWGPFHAPDRSYVPSFPVGRTARICGLFRNQSDGRTVGSRAPGTRSVGGQRSLRARQRVDGDARRGDVLHCRHIIISTIPPRCDSRPACTSHRRIGDRSGGSWPQEESKLKSEMTKRPDRLFLMSGPTLPEQLPEADWQELIAAMQARGIPGFLAARCSPGMSR